MEREREERERRRKIIPIKKKFPVWYFLVTVTWRLPKQANLIQKSESGFPETSGSYSTSDLIYHLKRPFLYLIFVLLLCRRARVRGLAYAGKHSCKHTCRHAHTYSTVICSRTSACSRTTWCCTWSLYFCYTPILLYKATRAIITRFPTALHWLGNRALTKFHEIFLNSCSALPNWIILRVFPRNKF